MNCRGISINDAAALCGVHRNTIHRWIREKRLNTVRISPKRQLIHPDEMKRFVKANLIRCPVGCTDVVYPVEETAIMLHVSEETVYRLLTEKRLISCYCYEEPCFSMSQIVRCARENGLDVDIEAVEEA